MKKPRYKQLRKQAWELCRQIALLRDDNKCVICGNRNDLQIDHCFSRQCGMLFYDPTNLNVLCSTCHTHKSFRKGGPVDKLVDQHTRHRVGGEAWRKMLEASWSPNPNLNKVWWLEEQIEELDETLEKMKKRWC